MRDTDTDTDPHDGRSEYRRSSQEPTSRAPPDDAAGAGNATGRSRRAFLASVGAGASALALGAASESVVAEHDEIPRDSVEIGDRGIDTPWLHREGNELRDPEGNKVVLRGVNVTDPARAAALPWRSPLWQNIEHATDPDRDWYARIVRIPVQTGDVANVDPDDGSVTDSPTDEVEPGTFSREQLETYLEEYLRPAVDFCADVGVYCIVDYHRHDDQSVEYTDPAVHDEVTMFWETVAPAFADDSHVLYEVYNEPIGPYAGEGQNEDYDVHDPEGEETWLLWRETAQPWVDTIREHAERNVIIIGSPRWSQWTYWAPHHEFEGENLAYAAHVYTHENLRPLEEYFGEPAEEVPVFLSEFGWTTDFNADFLVGTPEEHGQEFYEFLEEYDSIHWQVWCFDPFWQPIMFDFDDSNHEWELLGGDYQGEFFRDYLYEKRNDDIPLVAGEDGEDEEEGDDGEGGDEPPAIDGNQPADTTGDGLYNDVTGSGSTTTTDVTVFFENIENPAVTEYAEYYDFDGSGSVSITDVIELFESL